MSRLGGSLFKIIWAKQHLEQLRVETGKYVALNAYHFPVDVEGDDVTVSTPEITETPEFSISGLIGDCMTNLMASLDYIVWELANTYAGRPLVPPPAPKGDTISFPIFTDPTRFDKWAKGQERYRIPTAIIDEIKAVQPNNAGYEPLADLYLLVNQDKHRLLLVVQGELKSSNIVLTYGDAEFAAVSSVSNVAFNTSDPRLSPYDPLKMKVNAQVTPFVAFKDPSMPRGPVEVTVERITACVDRVVNGFINRKII
jgi:hypothetical protein